MIADLNDDLEAGIDQRCNELARVVSHVPEDRMRSERWHAQVVGVDEEVRLCGSVS